MTDITYHTEGLFTRFYPETKAGEELFRDFYIQNENSNAVLTVHLQQVLRQIRAAGYKVAKAKRVAKLTPQAMDEMLAELEGLVC